MPIIVNGDNTGNTDSYNAVVTALAAAVAVPGDAAEVVFPPGIFLIGSPVAVPSNVRIRGEGARIRKGTNAAQVIFNLVNVTNIAFQNLFFDNTGGSLPGPSIRGEGASNLLISGNSFKGGLGVELAMGCSRVRIAGNDFTDGRCALGVGTLAPYTPSSDIVFTDNTVRNMTDEGVDLNQELLRAVISNNSFFNASGTASGGGEVIDIGGGVMSDITVSGNSIDLNGQPVYGITVKTNGTASTTNRIAISGNSITNGSTTARGGMHLTHCSNVTVTGNTITGVYQGIYLSSAGDNILIAHNIIRNTASNCIVGGAGGANTVLVDGNDLQSNSTTTDTVEIVGYAWTIRNNTITGGRHAVSTLESAAALPCSVTGNDISGATTGIVCYASASTITGNTVHDNRSVGIYLRGASFSTVSGNSVTSNASAAPAQGWGIYLDKNQAGTACSHSVITGNVVAGGQNGIVFLAAADRVVLTSNVIYGNSGGTNLAGQGLLTNSVIADNIV